MIILAIDCFDKPLLPWSIRIHILRCLNRRKCPWPNKLFLIYNINMDVVLSNSTSSGNGKKFPIPWPVTRSVMRYDLPPNSKNTQPQQPPPPCRRRLQHPYLRIHRQPSIANLCHHHHHHCRRLNHRVLDVSRHWRFTIRPLPRPCKGFIPIVVVQAG